MTILILRKYFLIFVVCISSSTAVAQTPIAFYKPVNQLDAAVQTAWNYEITSLRLEAEAWDMEAAGYQRQAAIGALGGLAAGLSTAFNPNLAAVNDQSAKAHRASANQATLLVAQMETNAKEARMRWSEARTDGMLARGITGCERETISMLWDKRGESDLMAIEALRKSGAGKKKRHWRPWWGKVATIRHKATENWQKAVNLCNK